jgi:hypothetical protein
MKDISTHINDIVRCAKDFRQTANSLMIQLAETYHFEIKPAISFPKTIYKHYNNKMIFNNTWSFYFHGSHCRFEHLHTGQVLEILYIYSPEFGYIDRYFFLQYIRTTEKYKWLDGILSEDNIYAVIDQLVSKGMLLTEMDGHHKLVRAN